MDTDELYKMKKELKASEPKKVKDGRGIAMKIPEVTFFAVKTAANKKGISFSKQVAIALSWYCQSCKERTG